MTLRILPLSIGAVTFLSALIFSQSSVIEGDKRKLEPNPTSSQKRIF